MLVQTCGVEELCRHAFSIRRGQIGLISASLLLSGRAMDCLTNDVFFLDDVSLESLDADDLFP